MVKNLTEAVRKEIQNRLERNKITKERKLRYFKDMKVQVKESNKI